MDEITRLKFEEWFRYADDLGLSPFFRDRAGAGAPLVAEILIAEAVEIPAPTPPPMPKTKLDAQKLSPESTSRRMPSLAAAPGISLPIASGPSLFDATDKIEDDTLERIREDLGECTRCKLHERRHKIVFGTGNPSARLVFVGEGPGADEDAQGLPFVGRAGKLLNQMIEAMGLKREDVYICNVVKCRPPENRAPEKDEVATCSPYLIRQIDAIRPQVIVCLGSIAAQTMLSTNQGISRFRGQWLEFRGTRLLATYHPAYLLRNPAAKPEVWKDLQKVMAVLGSEPKKPASPR
jgi:uracil-DNA glycosylase family 4